VRPYRFALPLLALALALLVLPPAPPSGGAPRAQAGPLVFYTTPGATTPQMPLWQAIADGALPELKDMEVRSWKNLDDLRSAMLAGQGDLWLGHVEGFAQAARLGAPVKLVAITAWRKFTLFSNRPDIRTVDDLLACPPGTELAVAPPQSPAVPVLQSLERHGLPRFTYVAHEPKQLTLDILRGRAALAVLPEPLGTVLLQKAPGLKAVTQVEDLYGRFSGREPLLPLAGIAVNARLAEERPELVKRLQAALVAAGHRLAEHPEDGLAALPAEFNAFMPREIVRASLARDRVLVRPAGQCREAVARYLALIEGHAEADAQAALPEGLLWP